MKQFICHDDSLVVYHFFQNDNAKVLYCQMYAGVYSLGLKRSDECFASMVVNDKVKWLTEVGPHSHIKWEDNPKPILFR